MANDRITTQPLPQPEAPGEFICTKYIQLILSLELLIASSPCRTILYAPTDVDCYQISALQYRGLLSFCIVQTRLLALSQMPGNTPLNISILLAIVPFRNLVTWQYTMILLAYIQTGRINHSIPDHCNGQKMCYNAVFFNS